MAITPLFLLAHHHHHDYLQGHHEHDRVYLPYDSEGPQPEEEMVMDQQ